MLDGYWPDPAIRDAPNVTLVHHTRQIGKRAELNKATQIAKGKYLLILDAHCLLKEGWDKALAADCEYDWTVVPRKYDLDSGLWRRRGRKVVDYMYLSKPEERWLGGQAKSGFRGIFWPERNNDKEIDDLMIGQGSCYFMHRDRFFDLGGYDERYGQWGQEGAEIACKSWLSGGRQIVNKKVWYAHWQKGRSKMKQPRNISKRHIKQSWLYSVDMWMNNKWPLQTRKFEWLIEKFAPPTW